MQAKSPFEYLEHLAIRHQVSLLFVLFSVFSLYYILATYAHEQLEIRNLS